MNPRETGKLHYHEDEVRACYVVPKKLVHKNPAADMYEDSQDRKHAARDVDLPMRTMNIHLSEILPGKSNRYHKHHNEAAIYIIEGKGYSLIQGKKYEWEAGDFLYVPPMNWHAHYNTGEKRVLWMGITNKRLLNFLGLDRKIESDVHMTQEEVEAEIKAEKWSPYSYYNIDPEKGITFGKGHTKK